ncbi:MAG: TRAP transporter small permease subunit [Candidatus Lambdaproteobacteria bacterium]|nr:TRAP transporter small permease subunit [Candidatus Lambdaproteobacteria bacterium]
MHLLDNVERGIVRLAQWLCYASVFSLVLLTLVITLGVFMRYAFNAPLTWTDEIAKYCLVAIIFFGLTHTLQSGGHIQVDVLLNLAPLRVQNLLAVLRYGAGLFFSVVFAHACLLRFLHFWTFGVISQGDMATKLYIPATPLLIGSGMFLLLTGVKFLQSVIHLAQRGAH